MSDLIDRQKALNEIEKNAYRHTYIEQIMDIIKSLPSAQPDVTDINVGDTISRAAAIDALCTPNGILYPIRTIENLPSAQPMRKKGKWIKVDDAYNRISGRCSNCGWEAHLYEDDVVGMDYCPNCGCDMREGGEDATD